MYRARDTKLGREVAIKVLPAELAEDSERLSRFEREAKLLAQLNHPGIATLHGFEKVDGTPFLVMELVEGETLAERIARGPIPWDEARALFMQIAQAIEAAHGPLALLAVGALIGGVAVWLGTGTDAPTSGVRRTVVTLPSSAPMSQRPGVRGRAALSPDGKKIAYVADVDGELQIFLRPLDRLEPTPVEGTEGAQNLFFSPSGEDIAFLVGWATSSRESASMEVHLSTSATVRPLCALQEGRGWKTILLSSAE